MDPNFHSLPPLKRFRLLQQLESEPKKTLPSNPLQLSPSNLPTKKRKQSRHSFFDSNESQDQKENIPPNPINLLPAKKRIWALQPQLSLSPIKSPPRFDLNLEYNPNEEELNTTHPEIEPKKDSIAEIDDGILCSVCLSTDADPLDPIVFCDGCDLMVHSSCYGNPLIKSIPKEEWFCNRCLDTRKHPKNSDNIGGCCLCPEKGGAMKETKDGKWAHIVCALLIPEVYFEDSEGREGIEISRIPKRRWKGRCYLCKKGKEGCVVECSEMKCGLMFHVSCGLKEDLCIELKQGKGKGKGCSNGGGVVAAFCKDHTQLWEKQKQTGKFKIVARDEELQA